MCGVGNFLRLHRPSSRGYGLCVVGSPGTSVKASKGWLLLGINLADGVTRRAKFIRGGADRHHGQTARSGRFPFFLSLSFLFLFRFLLFGTVLGSARGWWWAEFGKS